MANIFRKSNPHLFDVVIDEIQSSLAANIEWLDTIFGRCERLVKTIEGRKYYSANWYDKGNDYILVAPDEQLGNFAFFALDEPNNLDDYAQGDTTLCKIGFSLIVWCDLRTINVGRDTEEVKEQMLQTLNGLTHLRNGRFTINKVWQKAENVFKDYDYDEIDNQFLMHPFAGFRFEGELEIDTLCVAYVPPTPPVIEPYIAGHIVDGSSTFTFTVNYQQISVPVDRDGNWKWLVDRTLTSLRDAFYVKQNIDKIEFECDISQVGDFYRCFYNNTRLENLTFSKKYTNTIAREFNNFVHFSKLYELDLSMFTMESARNTWSMFNSTPNLKTIDLSNADFLVLTNSGNMFYQATALSTLKLKPLSIRISLDFNNSSLLTAQSVINIFNAVAADNLTFAFHPIVGTMIDAALQDPTNYIYQAYWAADARGYHINYVY